MQFTELFLNPSGGTTAEQEESAPEEKRNKKKKEGKGRLGAGRGGGGGGGGRRRWWNEVGGSHGVSCFVREARPPAFFMFLCPEAPFRYRPRYTACARSPYFNTYTHTHDLYIYSSNRKKRAYSVYFPFAK